MTPEQRLLTASLLLAPATYLAADTTYAVRGWDDPTAGVLHVLGAVGYGLVVLQVAARLDAASRLRAALVLVGALGLAGNVAYGFDTIHTSLGDTPLVDQPGAAALIKPLGLAFPLALALCGLALARVGARWQGPLVLLAALAWPVAHIGNLGTLAVATGVALLVGFGSLVWEPAQPRQAATASRSTKSFIG